MSEPMFTRKRIILLVIPLVIDTLLSTVIGVADTVMVSNVGEAAVSGVALVDSINRMFIFVFGALSIGGTIIAAQYIGRGERHNACETGKQVTVAIFAISFTVAVICVLFRRPILSLIFGTVEDEVMKSSDIYFLITAISYPFMAETSTMGSLFRASGNSKLPMLISVGSNLINIGFNAVFIFWFGMGAAGAATGTLIARIFSFIVLYVKLRNPKHIVNISALFPYRPDMKMIKRILRIGVPAGLENGMFEVGKLVVQSMISTFGTASITAQAVTTGINAVVYTIGIGIGMGMTTVAGQCVGAKRYDEAKRNMINMTLVSMAFMLVLNALAIIFRSQITTLYGLTDSTAQLAEKLIIICCVGTMVLWPPAFVLPNGLRAAGDVKFTMIVGGVSMWTIRVIFGYILSVKFGLGVAGIWYALFGDWLIRTSFFVWRVYSDKWRKHEVLR